jgi:hypothetical protein
MRRPKKPMIEIVYCIQYLIYMLFLCHRAILIIYYCKTGKNEFPLSPQHVLYSITFSHRIHERIKTIRVTYLVIFRLSGFSYLHSVDPYI